MESARKASRSGSWMGAVIDAAQTPSVDVAVDLRCRERAVAEPRLDRRQVGAALEQVRGEGVAEPVGVGEKPSDRARVEPAAPRGEEEGIVCAGRQPWAHLQPAAEPVRGFLAERDDALLASLAGDVDRLAVEVDVREVQVDRFAAPEAGGVDELGKGAVSDLKRVFGAERNELRVDLFRLRCAR